MPELNVPPSGLLLAGPKSRSLSDLPSQTFFLTLNHALVQELIKQSQNGSRLELSLGNIPAILCGSESHSISPPTESVGQFDLFLTRPYERTRLAQQLPNTMSVFRKAKPLIASRRPSKTPKDANTNLPKPVTQAPNKLPTPADPPILDFDIEQLQNSMAAAEASKKCSITLTRDPRSKNGPVPKSKLLGALAASNLARKSLPTSPASRAQPPSQQPSPSLIPQQPASQQKMEKARKQRVMILHELAVQERNREYLHQRWADADEDFPKTLEKSAYLNPDTQLYAIAKPLLWKELDIWEYTYSSDADRQTAIANAIKQYDRMRLGASEPEWQMLLPKDERGKGKWLSVVQEKINRGPVRAPTPKIHAQTSADSGSEGSTNKNDDTKAKKSGPADAQAKRLLTTSKKTSNINRVTANPKEKSGKLALSAEYIMNSDSEVDSVSKTAKLSQQQKPQRPSATTTSSPVASGTSGSGSASTKFRKSQPASQHNTLKPQPQASKRRRPDGKAVGGAGDGDHSRSNTPLAKRQKAGGSTPIPKASTPMALGSSRPSYHSKNSGTSPGGAMAMSKTRNVSPVKSSPLSSPPFNASEVEVKRGRDLERDSEGKKGRSVKRPRPSEPSEPKDNLDRPAKRPASEAVVLPNELVAKAKKFRAFCEKYESLHHHISDMTDTPPDNLMADLYGMHDHLSGMKKEIYLECAQLQG